MIDSSMEVYVNMYLLSNDLTGELTLTYRTGSHNWQYV